MLQSFQIIIEGATEKMQEYFMPDLLNQVKILKWYICRFWYIFGIFL